MSLLKRWRALARPSPGVVVVVVTAWMLVVTALHVSINSPRPPGRVAEVRSVPVGGLPVT